MIDQRNSITFVMEFKFLIYNRTIGNRIIAMFLLFFKSLSIKMHYEKMITKDYP